MPQKDNPAAAFDHVRDNRAGGQKHALQIDVDHRIPHLFGHDGFRAAAIPFHQLGIANNAGVVDEHVDAAPALYYRSGSGFDGSWPGDIYRLKLRFAARPLDRRFQLGGRLVGDVPSRDFRAFLAKRSAVARPMPAAAPVMTTTFPRSPVLRRWLCFSRTLGLCLESAAMDWEIDGMGLASAG